MAQARPDWFNNDASFRYNHPLGDPNWKENQVTLVWVFGNTFHLKYNKSSMEYVVWTLTELQIRNILESLYGTHLSLCRRWRTSALSHFSQFLLSVGDEPANVILQVFIVYFKRFNWVGRIGKTQLSQCRFRSQVKPKVIQNKNDLVEKFQSAVHNVGLRAIKDIAASTFICEYTGIIRSLSDSESKKHDTYCFDVYYMNKVIFVIDAGHSRGSCLVRHVNCALSSSVQNCKFVQHNLHIYLVTTRAVRHHEELLSWYGNGNVLAAK